MVLDTVEVAKRILRREYVHSLGINLKVETSQLLPSNFAIQRLD